MIKICPICNKEFYAEEYKRKYCSYACNNKSRIKDKIIKECPVCKKIFKTSRKEQKYCSIECVHKSILKIRYCKECGKEILQKAKKKNKNYCSQKCMGNNKRKHFKICNNCGKEIKGTYKGKGVTIKTRFCSKSCFLTFKGESSIEKIVREYLEKIGIKFKTQEQFGMYVADFVLPAYKMVLEADGEYWHTRPRTIKSDKEKDILLKANGYEVFRIKERDINNGLFKEQLNNLLEVSNG